MLEATICNACSARLEATGYGVTSKRHDFENEWPEAGVTCIRAALIIFAQPRDNDGDVAERRNVPTWTGSMMMLMMKLLRVVVATTMKMMTAGSHTDWQPLLMNYKTRVTTLGTSCLFALTVIPASYVLQHNSRPVLVLHRGNHCLSGGMLSGYFVLVLLARNSLASSSQQNAIAMMMAVVAAEGKTTTTTTSA